MNKLQKEKIINMLNTTALVGRLTKEPIIKESGQNLVAGFSLAFNSGKEETSFIDCVAFYNNAKTTKDFLHKGDQIGIVGSLRQRKWTDKKGVPQSRIEIVVESIQLLTPKKKEEEPAEPDANELPLE